MGDGRWEMDVIVANVRRKEQVLESRELLD